MPSTYSPNLRLELIGTGEQQGTWGGTTNNNLGTLLEEAIGGYVSVTVSDVADTTLTTNNGSADQSRNMVLNLVGTLSAARNVICPAIEKLYVVKNATTGGFAVTIKVSGQTGVSVPAGFTYFIYVDGVDARLITGSLANQLASNVAITGGTITGITDLAVADGGTGASTQAGARTNLGAAASGANTDITSVALNNTGLTVKDTDASHVLSIVPGSNLSANRTFTITTGDGSRTLDMSSGNVTISTAGAALIDDADASAQRTTLGLGTMATQASGSVNITGGSITGITDLAIADGGTGASDAGTARTNLGLGTVSTQNSNSISITGGSITGITDLAIADGGTGASDAGTARTNLGLGTMATQSSGGVSITGGTITGITDLAIADGGTGASTAANARTNLGLGSIATQNSNSVSITGGSVAGITDLAIADGGTGASDAPTARTNLGLGTMATQASSAVSISGGTISGVAISGGSVTGITDLAVADGGTGASDAAGARTNLGLGTMATQSSAGVSISGGTITGITDLAVADGGTGASDAGTARTNLGLGTIATQNSNNVSITGGSVTNITDLAVADGGTGASNAAGARTNLGLGTAATLNVGTGANEVVQLNGSAQLPAVSGALLTNLSVISTTTYTSGSGTWTKPSVGTFANIRLWGAGGSGGKAISTALATTANYASGGGGGGFSEITVPLSQLGATVSYSIGAGGGAVSATVATDGNPGGNTTFGNFSASGGGGGLVGTPADSAGGAGGAFAFSGETGQMGSYVVVVPAPVYLSSPGGGAVRRTTAPGTLVSPGTTYFGPGTGGVANYDVGGTAGAGIFGGGGGGKTNGTSGSSGAGGDGRIEIRVW